MSYILEMSKRRRIVIENAPKDSSGPYEKLRDELFQYRVEIQAYKRSMSILWSCVAVIVSILGFFGYNRIETLLGEVRQKAQERLAQSDSLLAKVNTTSIDSLTLIVHQKTQALEAAITALENGTRVNNVIYKKLISGLQYNKRVEVPFDTIKVKVARVSDEFDLVYYSENYTDGEMGECYVIMGDDYFKERDDVLLVQVFPRDWFIPVYSQPFEVHGDYNRLFFKFSRVEPYKDYEIAVFLLRKRADGIIGYRITKPIFIN